MTKQVICNNKFEFGDQTIALPVFLENLPDEIIFQGNTFLLKLDLHVSLVCIGEIIKKHNIIISDFETKVISDFCKFSQNNNVETITYANDFKFVARDDLKSIIAMCHIPNLNKFFDLLNQKYSLNIEYPPTHITLYTPSAKFGIYLTDSNDLKNLTVSIKNPIGHLL